MATFDVELRDPGNATFDVVLHRQTTYTVVAPDGVTLRSLTGTVADIDESVDTPDANWLLMV